MPFVFIKNPCHPCKSAAKKLEGNNVPYCARRVKDKIRKDKKLERKISKIEKKINVLRMKT